MMIDTTPRHEKTPDPLHPTLSQVVTRAAAAQLGLMAPQSTAPHIGNKRVRDQEMVFNHLKIRRETGQSGVCKPPRPAQWKRAVWCASPRLSWIGDERSVESALEFLDNERWSENLASCGVTDGMYNKIRAKLDACRHDNAQSQKKGRAHRHPPINTIQSPATRLDECSREVIAWMQSIQSHRMTKQFTEIAKAHYESLQRFQQHFERRCREMQSPVRTCRRKLNLGGSPTPHSMSIETRHRRRQQVLLNLVEETLKDLASSEEALFKLRAPLIKFLAFLGATTF